MVVDVRRGVGEIEWIHVRGAAGGSLSIRGKAYPKKKT